MDIIALIVIAFLVVGAIVGFKRGATRELVSLFGIFVVFILAYLFKNPVSVFFYKHLPFFNFAGSFKGITVLNILLYEVVAFLVVFAVLCVIFRLVLIFTNCFEQLLDSTILLGLPSKIIGAILGIIEVYIYIFLAILLLKSPLFNFKEINNSELTNKILRTPILSKVSERTLNVIDQIFELKDEYKETDNIDEFNQKALDAMIENKVITKDNAIMLIKKGKLKGVVVN